MATFNGNVYGGSLNLRATPSTGGTALASIPNGTALAVSTFTGTGSTEWFSTSYGGQSGYVMAKFINIPSGGQTGQVTTASGSLNIRATPNSGATILYTAPQYSYLRVLDTTSVSGWYRVCGSGGTGWAVSTYITISADTTLRLGDSGDAVWAMQQKLMNKHYYHGHSDYLFDSRTEWAVKYFQDLNDLTVDGVVGSATMAKLDDPYAVIGVDPTVVNRGAQGPAEPGLKMGYALWANVPFDASGTPQTETIGDSGNAPAAIAIAFSTLFENAVTPPVICDYVMSHGLRDNTGNTGVTSAFFNSVAGEFQVYYSNTTTSVTAIQNHCAAGGIAVVRIIGDAAHNYCSPTGATYLVVNKVDSSYVHIQNANGNASNANVARSVWDTASWVKEAHLYSL